MCDAGYGPIAAEIIASRLEGINRVHGGAIPVGVKMEPFPPVLPNGSRSSPPKDLSKGADES